MLRLHLSYFVMSKCTAFHFVACVQTPLPSVKIDFKGEVGASIHRLFTLLIVNVFILSCKVGGEEGLDKLQASKPCESLMASAKKRKQK